MNKQNKTKGIFFILFLSVACHAWGQINYANSRRLNNNWEFLQSDLGSIWEAVRPVAKASPEEVPIWTTVSLPHCFNATDAVEPGVNYYQGPGWYRSNIDVENPYKDGRTILYFEGVGQKTDVYVYTQKVGSHIGGYDEWSVDITDAIRSFLASPDAVRFGGKIPLSIRCDNSRDSEMIPSDLSDFNIYGGIYRYLNLVYTPALAFSSIQTDARVDAQGKEGNLSIKAKFTNVENSSEGSINIKIKSPNGKVIQEKNITLKNFSAETELLNISIPKPELWSPDLPKLYSCELKLSSDKGKMLNTEKFGFRHFEFVEHGPFRLNGKRLLIRGTHRHEDHAGVAAAMTEEMIVAEMELMKQMGVNFIRLGHYQQSRIILEACDRLGILVWEEIPWCRGGLGGNIYKEQARRMLTNMIGQHRNHPAVILWGLGNENDWPNDFQEFDKDKIRAFMAELHNLSHQLDDTRLTSIRRCEFCKDIVDVYSPSLWAGWYQGIFTDYKQRTHDNMLTVKHFLHVEWGGDSHAGRYAEDIPINKGMSKDSIAHLLALPNASKVGDWSETYICNLIDWHLMEQENMPWLSGAAYWPFKDFSTPVRPENPIPYVNQKGVVERDLTPKESYYVFQSYWTEKPMVHIYGHTFATRWGKEDEAKMVKIYSNCEEVELFVNGKSAGIKKRNSQDYPAAGLRWETIFSSGKNELKAIGKKGKEQVEDQVSFDYETRPFGKEAKIVTSLSKNDDGSYWVNVQLQDEKGVICLNSQQFVYFKLIGAGRLIENQGTASASNKVQVSNGRARIRVIPQGGKSIVSVKSDGLETQFATIN